MSKPLKVAVIEPIGGHGGNEFYDFGLCEAVALKHKVFLFTCDETVLDTKVNLKTEVIKCFKGIYGKSNRFLRGLRYVLGTLYALFFCLKNRIDIVHIHYYGFSLLEKFNLKLFKLARFRVVATVHDIEPFDRFGEELSLDYDSFFNPVDAIIVHTDFSAKCLANMMDKSNFSKVIKVKSGDLDFVYNVDIEKQKAREELNLPVEKTLILFFGHIKKVKGLDLLLNAFNKVALNNMNVCLLVVGRPWKVNVEEYFSMVDEKIKDRVLFRFDYIPNEQVNLYFKATDIVVLPYRKIYNSSLILRSFDYGSCVLASNLETFKEFIIERETGLLFEKDNAEDLAEKLNFLLKNPSLAENIKANAKKFVESNFSRIHILKGMDRVYDFVLNTTGEGKAVLNAEQKD